MVDIKWVLNARESGTGSFTQKIIYLNIQALPIYF